MRFRVSVAVLMFVLMASVVALADSFTQVGTTIGDFAKFGVFPSDSHLTISNGMIDAVLKFNFPQNVLTPPVSETSPNGTKFSWFPGDLLFYVGSDLYGIALVNHGFSVVGEPPPTSGVDALKVYKTNSFLTADDLLSGLGFIPSLDYRENAAVWLANDNLALVQGGGLLMSTGVPGNGSPFTVHITGQLPTDFATAVAQQGFTAYFASTECANGYMMTEKDPTPEVPEPASLLMLGSGLLGIGAVRHRFRKAK